MQIKSNFRDYYDNVQTWGRDPQLLYVRVTREQQTEEPRLLKLPARVLEIHKAIPKGYYTYGNVYFFGLIGFCGRLYPWVNINNEICYTSEEIVRALKQPSVSATSTVQERLKEFESDGTYRSRCSRRYYRSQDRLIRRNWEALLKQDLSLSDDFFRELQAPVFCYSVAGGTYCLAVNPRLNAFRFQAQVDPVTAWQRLSMYVGNNLANQMDPNPKISDELKRDSAGFDKWSFRRHRDDPK